MLSAYRLCKPVGFFANCRGRSVRAARQPDCPWPLLWPQLPSNRYAVHTAGLGRSLYTTAETVPQSRGPPVWVRCACRPCSLGLRSQQETAAPELLVGHSLLSITTPMTVALLTNALGLLLLTITMFRLAPIGHTLVTADPRSTSVTACAHTSPGGRRAACPDRSCFRRGIRDPVQPGLSLGSRSPYQRPVVQAPLSERDVRLRWHTGVSGHRKRTRTRIWGW
jgi:hypothetical protein